MQTLSFVSIGHKWHNFAFLPAGVGEVKQWGFAEWDSWVKTFLLSRFFLFQSELL